MRPLRPMNVYIFFTSSLENLISGDHHAHVNHIIAVALQHHAHDVFANVVDITFDGCQQNFTVGLVG